MIGRESQSRELSVATYDRDEEKIKNKIPYKNGKTDGVWKTYYENGKLKREVLYVEDKPVSGKLYEVDGTIKELKAEDLDYIKRR